MSTKKLARELGIIRKRSQNKEPGETKRAGPKQYFSYLIIIDFESTCWREKNNYGQEIIEFPAVLLNVSTGAVESEFHTYVQPQEHPVLSEFCTELTGITQRQVESGVPLAVCLSRFSRWLHSLQQERGVVFVRDSRAPLITGSPCAFVTWSDWDLGVCLLYECKRKQISKPEALNSWIDLRATYKLFYSRKPKGLNGALQDLGIEFSGREHSGLDDARNTARLAWRMITDGCFMKITKSLDRAQVKSKPMFPNAPVKNESSNQHGHSKNETQDGPNERGCKSTTAYLHTTATEPSTGSSPHTTRFVNQNKDACQYENLVTPRTVLNSLSACLYGGALIGSMTRQLNPRSGSGSGLFPQTTGLVLVSTAVSSHTDLRPKQLNFDLEASEVDWTDGVMLPETEESGSYDDVVLEEDEKEEQNDNNGCGQGVTTNSSSIWEGPRGVASSSVSCLPPAPADSVVVVAIGGPEQTSANRPPAVTNPPQATSEDTCFKKPLPILASAGDRRRSLLRPFVHQITPPSASATHSSIHKPAASSCSVPGRSLQKVASVDNSSFASNGSRHGGPTPGSSALSRSLRSTATSCSSNASYSFNKSTASSGSVLPSPLHQSKTSCGRTAQRVARKTTTPSSTLTIYQDVELQPSTSTSKWTSSGGSSTGGSSSVPASVLSSRVNQSRPASSRAAGKVTAPLCSCGRRAKRLTVGNGGPNHGRAFYCCPVRRSGSGPGPAQYRKGCEFFKWESALVASVTPGPSKTTRRGGATATVCPPSGRTLR